MGHQTQERQGLQSTSKTQKTRTTEDTPKEEFPLSPHLVTLLDTFRPDTVTSTTHVDELEKKQIHEDFFPPHDGTQVRTNQVIYAIEEFEEKITGYMDLTGRFPIKSARGNEYLLVAYNWDANSILVEPLKNKEAQTITNAWEKINKRFSTTGMAPNHWILDNEKSKILMEAFSQNKVTHKFVSSHSHRANKAERAIQTFKNHFKSGLASVNPDFPSSQWDRLLPQAEMTLNMLRRSRINCNISAYMYQFGNFNWNKTPLAPPGTKVVAHDPPNTRGTWDLNGTVGWYVGPAMEHYRCVDIYFPKTKSVRHCQSVDFFPHAIDFPEVKLEDFLKQTASDLVEMLANPPSTTALSLETGSAVKNAFLKISNALKLPSHQMPQFSENPNTSPRVEEEVFAQDVAAPRVEPKETRHEPDLEPTPSIAQRVKNRRKKKVSFNLKNNKYHEPSTCVQTKILNAISYLKNKYCTEQQHTEPIVLPSIISYKQRAAQALAINEYIRTAYSQENECIYHVYDTSGNKIKIEELINGTKNMHGEDKQVWNDGLSNEIGQITQGNDAGVTYQDCCEFIYHHEVPTHKKVTYAYFIADYRPLKPEPYRLQLVVGGDKLTTTKDVGSPSTNILDTKILANSVISDAHKGARFMTLDIKDFFLCSEMT